MYLKMDVKSSISNVNNLSRPRENNLSTFLGVLKFSEDNHSY